MTNIPFNRPSLLGDELDHMRDAVERGWISGDGHYTKECHKRLAAMLACEKVLLTTSCTDALEMAAMLCDVGPGDEVIIPDFTFVSTANAFASRGATPVFVDVREDTLNLDESLLAGALTPRTKAIVPVHYAGVACEMDEILRIARGANVRVVEDAAQAVGATHRGRPLGGLGDLGAFSFHETKNLHCGEGGALAIGDPALAPRAEVLWQKGTNRNRFLRGEVDKYTWCDFGSSFLPSDLLAAFLLAQLGHVEAVTRSRRRLHGRYMAAFEPLEREGRVRRPRIPAELADAHNGHIFFLLCADANERDRLIAHLRAAGIHAVFHYQPLHKSEMGARFAKPGTACPVSARVSEQLVRLPIYHGLRDDEQERVIDAVTRFYLAG